MTIWAPILWTLFTGVIAWLWVAYLSRISAYHVDPIAAVIGAKLWAILVIVGWFTWAVLKNGEL